MHSGFAACLELQRELGLYAHEVYHSVDQFNFWRQALSREPGNHPAHVLVGAPERRSSRHILPCSSAHSLALMEQAASMAKFNRRQLLPLLPEERLSQAYARLCASIGVSAIELEHDLRCLYARDQFLACLPGGQTEDLERFLQITGWVAGLLGEDPAHDAWRVWWTYLHLNINPTPAALPVSLAFE